MKRMVVILALLALFGCELFAPPPPMEGTWEWIYQGTCYMTLAFSSDKTCEVWSLSNPSVHGTYSYTSTTIAIEWEGGTVEEMSYRIAGDSMTITLKGSSVAMVLTKK
jgi:hypothetical protein